MALEERLLAPLPNATWIATPEWDRRSSITATCVRTRDEHVREAEVDLGPRVVIPGRDGHNVLDWRRSFWLV